MDDICGGKSGNEVIKKESRVSKKVEAVRRKAYNLQLAKQFTQGVPLMDEERLELDRIYAHDDDRKAGEYLFKLRKMKFSKGKICKVLSVDPRTLDRLYGTMVLSDYLRMVLDQAAVGTQEDGFKDVDVMTYDEFQVENKKQLKIAMAKVLNGVTEDKIFDATIDEIASAYKKLYDAHRLENDKTTSNNGIAMGGIITLVSEERCSQRQLESEKMDKQIEELQKSLLTISQSSQAHE